MIWDIQRIGPSTGLPTRTSQADLLSVAFLSHGDTRHVMLLPATVEDCYEFGMRAFDLAERLQTPVFVMSDLDLGMNVWMSDPFRYPDKPWDRGKVLQAADLERLGKFERYRDVDGDAIPYRTLPGTPHPLAAYFTRGSGHDEQARYTESSEAYPRVMDRLARKFETARGLVPAPIVDSTAGAEVGLVAFGSTHHAMREARDQLRGDGIKTSYLLLRALPVFQGGAPVRRVARPDLRDRAEPRRADGGAAEDGVPNALGARFGRSSTTTACRSTRPA